MHAGAAEQPRGDLGAAGRVDVEVDRIVAHRGPQPGTARSARFLQRLDAPDGLVAVANRSPALVREDRFVERLEQRQEAGHAVGQRPDRDRQPLVRHPCGDPVQGS